MLNDPPTPANDQTVTVGFDTTTKTFSFSNDSVTMDRPGRIILVRDDPSDRSWALSNVVFDGNAGPLSVESRSGNQIVIDDYFTQQQLGTYSYEVVVTYGTNGTSTSPDPKIVNENPS